MAKTQPAAPQTLTWIPTRADTTEVDADGNVIAVNGISMYDVQQPGASAPGIAKQDHGDS